MRVNKRVLIPTRENVAIMSVATSYVGRDSLELIQEYTELRFSDTFDKFFQRRSKDNGRTWSDPRLDYESRRTTQGIWRWGENNFFLDEKKNVLLYFYNYELCATEHHTRDILAYIMMFYKVSYDEGKAFVENKQVIQEGYNEKNWVRDVIFGKNCMIASHFAPLLVDGDIVLPVQRVPLGSDLNRLIPWEAGCLVGRWQGNSIEWTMGDLIHIDARLSSRGLCEPTVAQLKDSSLLMICRGSNAGIRNTPGRKWYALSHDQGFTWSEPQVLKCSDGSHFFSPASGSRLIRSCINNRLYWIGNIVKENPDGNWPRYPLQISQIDEKNIAVQTNSIRVIDDKRGSDSGYVELSNFKVYEDRETHEFVLTIARRQEKGKGNFTSPAYEYRINVLEKFGY